ncbi:MAG: hypothetical protein P4N60_14265 [Verrucomicrobiae bacterium]|nr:hypothetical protein [Verrucomicrobiae bacterium]
MPSRVMSAAVTGINAYAVEIEVGANCGYAETVSVVFSGSCPLSH